MTITGLCQPENASQIKFPSGKLNALSGQSIKAQVIQRPAILYITLTALQFPRSHLVETKHKKRSQDNQYTNA